MLCVSAYTHERRPYSATLYPTSFTLDSSLALTIRAQRQTYSWWYNLCPMAVGDFSCDCMFWENSGGGLAPVGPRVDTATIRTVLSTDRVGSGSMSSGCCAFRRTHTSADPIGLLCTRLALPLTLPLPSRFAPSARLTVGGTTCALWLVGDFSCDCIFWENSGGGITTQPVGTATMTTVTSANRVDLESFSSRCRTFRRTHTSADPIRILCTRLALPLAISLPS